MTTSSRRGDAVALAAVALALVVRLIEAGGTFLNPDEALHFLLVNQPGLVAVYHASLSNAHPPLFFLLLYLWHLVGSSELWLRLFPVLAGTAAVWVAYKWIGRLAGQGAALAGAFLLALLPSLVTVSAEVRHYGPLLLFVAGALWFHERVGQDERWFHWLGLGLLLYAAVLTHYSALILVIALGLHGAYRLASGGWQRKSWLPWLFVQAGAAGMYALLYFSHIRDLAHRGMSDYAREIWLAGSYFRPGLDSLWLFPGRTTVAAFGHMFGSAVGGVGGLVLFLAGLALLLVTGQGTPARRRLGQLLLLSLPFAVAIGLALAGLFPFGGSRHTVFLALFATAGIGVALGRLAGGRHWVAVGLALLTGAALSLTRTKPDWEFRRADQRRELMTQAVARLEVIVPEGDTLLADYQSSVLLGYYFGRDDPTTDFGSPERGWHFLEYRGRTVVATGHSELWTFSRQSFGRELDRLVASGLFGRSERVPVFDAGWGPMRVDAGEEFGHNIRLFTARLDSWSTPVNLDRRLAGYADRLLAGGRHWRAVFWPTALLSDSVRRSVAPLADRVLSYAQARDSLEGREHELAEYLPALAFWTGEREERRPSFMDQLDSLAGFRRGGYWYGLLALGEDSSVAVYSIGRPEAHIIDSLAREAANRVGRDIRTVLIPDERTAGLDRTALARLAGSVFTFGQLYDSLTRGRSLDDFVPALAFWKFGPSVPHPETMYYMDDRENYITAGFRFTLLATDADTLVGVYLVETDR